MKVVHWFGLLLLGVAGAVAGCGTGGSGKATSAAGTSRQAKDTSSIQKNLAKLSPEDRKLAQAQKLCPISEEPLGEMGVPVKVMLEGQPVFLCCRSCLKKAEANPEKTLAKVKKLEAGSTAK
jgi:hypothetical protein